MAPISAAENQKLLMQQEIAKLSGAITRHSAEARGHGFRAHPYTRGRAGQRGSARGRGRGGSYSLDLRHSPAAGTAAAAAAAASAGPSTMIASAPSASSTDEAAWVKNPHSRSGNISIMTAEKRAQLQARPAKPRQAPGRLQTAASSSSDGQRVVIDGVIFQFEQGGAKLSRIGEVASSGTPTRRRVSYGGNKYRRTSKGHLVQAEKKSKRDIPCRYYTKTGRCNRALTCPYAHVPGRVAICPRFLRSACDARPCSLSHRPSAHNTPSCLRFQATSTCRQGDACVYPHVRVSPDAPVCEAFARGGWCDEEPGACPNVHVWECGEFRQKGTCARGGKCGLRHVLRAVESEETSTVTAVSGSFEENSDYVDLDHGQPSAIGGDSDDDQEDASSTSDDDDYDDDGDDEDEDDDDLDVGIGAVGVDEPRASREGQGESITESSEDEEEELLVH